MAASRNIRFALACSISIICLMINTDGAPAQQQRSCPVTNKQKYDAIITRTNPYADWFQAASTPALAQAAYAFDVPRVKCLLAAKADVNQRVQNSLTGPFGGNQWALGAAVGHIASYTDSGVTTEMVETVQLLLDAGANPNIRYYSTPLDTVVDVVGRCRFRCPSGNTVTGTGCCPTEQNMLKVIKALVAAGADTRTALESAIGSRVNVGERYCDAKDPGFAEVVDFLISKGSAVNGPVRGTGNEDCPKLQTTLSKAAQKSG